MSTSRLRYFCIIPSSWLPANGGDGPPVGPTVTRTLVGPDGQPLPQTVTLPGAMPSELWEALICPGDATRALLCVEHWASGAEEDQWRATPGVISLPDVWDWGKIVPPLAVALFGPYGVTAADTMASAAAKIRAVWPRLRH